MEETIVLIFGPTGGGKSTLANTILAADQEKGTAFTESDLASGCTATWQSEETVLDGRVLKIVDTSGFDDPSLTTRQVMSNIVDAVQSVPHINQIFFVSSAKFTARTNEIFELVEKNILGSEMCPFVTLVQTHFGAFRDIASCEIATEDLKKNCPHGHRIINSFAKIILVDNPNRHANPAEWVERRKDSRHRLLCRLEFCTTKLIVDRAAIKGRMGSFKTKEEIEEERRLERERREAESRRLADAAARLAEENARLLREKQAAEDERKRQAEALAQARKSQALAVMCPKCGKDLLPLGNGLILNCNLTVNGANSSVAQCFCGAVVGVTAAQLAARGLTIS